MSFEWDPAKASANVKKHGITFDEAATVFLDPMALSGPDPDHSSAESRYISFGMSSLGAFTGGVTCISSRWHSCDQCKARYAHRKETL